MCVPWMYRLLRFARFAQYIIIHWLSYDNHSLRLSAGSETDVIGGGSPISPTEISELTSCTKQNSKFLVCINWTWKEHKMVIYTKFTPYTLNCIHKSSEL